MSWEGGGPPEESQLSWVLASREAPIIALFLPLFISYHSRLIVTPQHPFPIPLPPVSS